MKGFDLFMKNQYRNCSFNYKHGRLELITESGDMLFSVSLRDACSDEDITRGKVDESTKYAIQDYIEMCLMDSGASCDSFTLESVVDMIYEDTEVSSKMFSCDLGDDNSLSEFNHFFGESSAVERFNARYNKNAKAPSNSTSNNNSKQSKSDDTKEKEEENKHLPLDDVVAQYIIDAYINSYAAKTNADSTQNQQADNGDRDKVTKNDLIKLGVSSSKIETLSEDTYKCYRDKVQCIRDAVDTIEDKPKLTDWKYYITPAKDNNGEDCVLVYFAYKDIKDYTYQMSFHMRKHDETKLGKDLSRKVGNKVKIERKNVEHLESLIGKTDKITYSKIGARIPAKRIKKDFKVNV